MRPPLIFPCPPDTLHRRGVIAIARPAPGGDPAELPPLLLIGVGTLWGTTVGGVEQARAGAVRPDRVPPGVAHQGRRHPGLQGIPPSPVYRSLTPATSTPPSPVGTVVRSVSQVSFGRVAVHGCARRCSATGRCCAESVVIVHRGTGVPRRPSFFRRRVIRPIPAGKPSSRRSGPSVGRGRTGAAGIATSRRAFSGARVEGRRGPPAEEPLRDPSRPRHHSVTGYGGRRVLMSAYRAAAPSQRTRGLFVGGLAPAALRQDRV